jgi:DNA-binding transcriptional ArsR family regulator
MEIMRVPQARISQHLFRLRSEGLVSDRRESQWVIYSLNKELLDQRLKGLDAFMRGPAAEMDCLKDEFERLSHIENRGLLSEKLTKGCQRNANAKKTSKISDRKRTQLRKGGSSGKEARA